MRKSLLWAAALTLGLTLSACEDDPAPPPENQGAVSESALQDQMRQLWTERVFWERALMISTLHGLGDRQAISERLRKNTNDLAAAFDVFYSSIGAGTQLTSYLDTDQNLFESALAMANNGNDIGMAKEPWKDNIKQLADYLESLNADLPGSVDGDLNDYVDHAFDQIEQRQVFDWMDDVNAFDDAVENANKLADAFTEGFRKQYPDNVTEEPNGSYQELRTTQRKLWMDHFMWHHFFNSSGVHSLPDLAATRQRTLRNQAELGDSIKPLYGPSSGEQLNALLRDHVLNSEQVVNYTRLGDAGAIAASKAIGYATADQIAQFLSNANPNLPLEATRPSMKRHQDLVYEDIDALFVGDFARDISTLDEFEAHLLETSDAISSATQAMFPAQVNQ